MKLRVLAATSALVAVAAPALAQKAEDTPPDPTPVIVETAPIAPFAGGYAGAQLGYGFGNVESSNGNAIDEDGDGVVGGLHAGYLFQNGQFVYGGEVDYDFADVEFDNDAGSLDGLGRIKAKAGYDFGGTMLYGTAGAVYGDADIDGGSFNDWGWTAGAGVDHFITDRVTVGGEVLYNDFGEFDDSNVDLTATTVTARVSYRF